MAELLDAAAVTDALDGLPGWTRDGDSLVRTAKLPSFPAAIGVVDRVAEYAEAQDHHPDIDIRWRTLTFRCSTHSDGRHHRAATSALAAAISAEVQEAGGE